MQEAGGEHIAGAHTIHDLEVAVFPAPAEARAYADESAQVVPIPLMHVRDAADGNESYQCLSACCGVVTRSRRNAQSEGGQVTNAFRPVVVLLQR